MTGIILKFRLFLGSYAVLFGILAVRFTDRWLAASCAALAVFGLVDNWRIATVVTHKEPHSVYVKEIRDQGAEVSGYLATYLLPFVTVAEPSGRDLVAYGLFLAVTCVVYVRSEMVQINPVLYLIRRRVVAVTTVDDARVHLITKSPPNKGERINAVPLRGEQVMVQVRSDDEE